MSRSQRLIARQLRKAGVSAAESESLQSFLALVEASYDEFEKHRQLTTRLASEELALTLRSLGESEELFKSLARCSPNGIIHTDIAGNCLYANERAQELIGRPYQELLGSGWMESIPSDDRGLFYSIEVGSDEEADADRTIEHRVVLGDGEVIWASTVIGRLSNRDNQTVGWVANFEDITERKMHEQELSLLARHDSLTGLLNRHALRQSLDEMFSERASVERVAIALIDLDHFKLVNDTFGHEVGDSLLVTVAKLLQSAAGEHYVVARLGGDEFAFATRLREGDTADRFGSDLAELLHGPVDIGSRTVSLAASVGVAVANGRNETPAGVLRDADTAMYRSKRSTQRRYEIFDESYREEVTRRFAVENELRDAIEHDAIGLEYQPVLDTVTGKIFTVAALARWESDTLGQVPPMEFISIAEDLGLIGLIGEKLLAKACAQLSAWRRDVPALSQMAVSCKISPLQLSNPHFTSLVTRTLAVNGLPGTALILEVTEGAILGDLERSMGVLTTLRQLGIQIAIDDFGTGYSSLAYLDRVPVDFMKIDRSFVELIGEGSESESSNRLTEAIVRLALRFGLTPVAVGVETEEQSEILRRAGCELSQGYLLAEPMPAEDSRLIELLRSHNEKSSLRHSF